MSNNLFGGGGTPGGTPAGGGSGLGLFTQSGTTNPNTATATPFGAPPTSANPAPAGGGLFGGNFVAGANPPTGSTQTTLNFGTANPPAAGGGTGGGSGGIFGSATPKPKPVINVSEVGFGTGTNPSNPGLGGGAAMPNWGTGNPNAGAPAAGGGAMPNFGTGAALFNKPLFGTPAPAPGGAPSMFGLPTTAPAPAPGGASMFGTPGSAFPNAMPNLVPITDA